MDNTEKEKQIKKAIEKSLSKFRGKFLEAKRSSNVMWKFVLYKGSGDKKQYRAFTTYDPIVISLISTAVRNQRFKAKFKINSTLYMDKWYTYLTCVVLEDWIINEDKIAKAERLKASQTSMFEQHQYNKSILGKDFQEE